MRAAPTPVSISTNSVAEIEKKGTAASPATAFASRVLPQPGGPASRTPRGGFAPTDRGAGWSSPIRLNDDPCTSGATQRNPWISVAPNGRVDAIFYDNRDDSTDPRDRYGVRYANSTDGGLSFGSNPRVSDVDFDATTFFAPRSQGFQSNEFDQVNGIDSTDTGAVGAWGDSRQAPSSTSTRSDVFSVGIGFAEPGPGPGPAPGTGPGGGGGDGNRVRPNLLRPRARAVQRGRKVVVRVRGRMVGNRGRRCGGRIKIGTRAGVRRAATRVGRMGRNCRYAKRYLFPVRRLPPRLRPRNRKLVLRIKVRYQGNSRLKPDLSPTKRVRVRR